VVGGGVLRAAALNELEPIPLPPAAPVSAWAPLRDHPIFRALWIAQFGSNIGTWMQTVAGLTSPAVVLTLTFVLGCGNAVASPAWQAIQPDLVDRAVLPQAAALNGVNMNLARAVGPAVGGVIVAGFGAGWVFALNAVSSVGIAALVFSWRPRPTTTAPPAGSGSSRRCARVAVTCTTP
jgi:predicted MFS family arabinose efflux permease